MTAAEIDALLADFRLWIQEASESGQIAAEPPQEPVDLYTLVAQFTALRHEVNLQTRAVRAQQEQTVQVLQQFEAAENSPPALPADPSVDALLKSLIEAADVQILAARELQRVAQGVQEALDQRDLAQKSSSEMVQPSFIGRLLGIGRVHAQFRQFEADLAERLAPPQTERIRDLVVSAAAGLGLGLQRIERTMRHHGLEPIPAVGHDFDPETMEAVEVAVDSGRPPGEVVDELRRGYLWNGAVFRYAQVRVAK